MPSIISPATMKGRVKNWQSTHWSMQKSAEERWLWRTWWMHSLQASFISAPSVWMWRIENNSIGTNTANSIRDIHIRFRSIRFIGCKGITYFSFSKQNLYEIIF